MPPGIGYGKKSKPPVKNRPSAKKRPGMKPTSTPSPTTAPAARPTAVSTPPRPGNVVQPTRGGTKVLKSPVKGGGNDFPGGRGGNRNRVKKSRRNVTTFEDQSRLADRTKMRRRRPGAPARNRK